MRIILIALLLTGCVQNTTRETDHYVRVSCSGASGGFIARMFGVFGGNTQYKQITASIELTPEEAKEILSTYKCGEETDLAAIKEILGD